MNHGRYLEDDLLDAERSDFCIGVGGYPEKHIEAPNLETDVRRTRDKVEAGGEYIVTQMFFDNQAYFSYVDRCRAAGIDVPIIPGLKILSSKRQLTTLPREFFISVPNELSDEVMEARPEHVKEIGVRWALAQTQELLERGAPAVHFYVMLSATAIRMLMERLDL
jgi:methylenetetrahydrofolate reductase (NADPH)